MTKYMRP